VIDLGLDFITHKKDLIMVSFNSLQIVGAKGARKGVPKERKEHIWARMKKKPIKIP